MATAKTKLTAALVGALIFTLAFLFFAVSLAVDAHAEWTTVQSEAHAIAQAVRDTGADEDHPDIVEATRVWWEEENNKYIPARTTRNEARGIASVTELSCIMWTILNRVDAGYAPTIYAVATAPHQFAYSDTAPTTTDHGIDLLALAGDVLNRWHREKAGETDVGRTLPSDYLWYSGDGRHNYFRNAYRGGTRWDYSLPSPYEN